MEQEKVIQRIKETAEQVLPANASLWLYGSRARGDARPDSDYDLLILLDKDRITSTDHDNYGYPLRASGWDIWTEINPHIYTKRDWESWSFSPFYKNVEHDKIVLQ
ncbi:MAG: nucleotidyltransferase domain-containing protein [Bacteroidales bacterium]|nr:nucleotidyltransferase domain-containing protein [Bacteroidales bacterium]